MLSGFARGSSRARCPCGGRSAPTRAAAFTRRSTWPRRIRVQARQVYAYAEAGRLGWQGPWRDAVAHGLDFILKAYRRPDGFFRTLVSPEGEPLDETVDIYDQAFVLFALAHAYDANGRPAHLLEPAETLLNALVTTLGHPGGGFDEAVPRRLPLRSNPHMHLLEAMLTWVGFGVETPFAAKANEIVDLACSHLIDPRTGAIGEYYDAGWGFAPGEEGGVREPGHQFEWAYLLNLAGPLLKRDMGAFPARLWDFGATHGIDPARKVAVFALDADGKVTEFEDNLIWRAADLLHVSREERIALKRRVAGEQGTE